MDQNREKGERGVCSISRSQHISVGQKQMEAVRRIQGRGSRTPNHPTREHHHGRHWLSHRSLYEEQLWYLLPLLLFSLSTCSLGCAIGATTMVPGFSPKEAEADKNR
jgi:hypothetical protein